MTGIAKVTAGSLVRLDDDREYLVCRFETPMSVVLRDTETHATLSAPLERIRCRLPAHRRGNLDLEAIAPARLDTAESKYHIIKPLLEAGSWTTADVENAAKAAGVARSTVYRWLKSFAEGNVVSNLMRKQRNDSGKTRLPDAVEKIIGDVIADYWLTPERRTPAKTYREVKRLCFGASPRLEPPSLTTFLARLETVDAEYAARKREGVAAADKLKLHKGTVPFADRPYGLLQIDHTPVDVHLVDQVHRVWIGRPWLTVAIDVYSRMVAGYYVSFDPPGALATGICIANAMLPKRRMLSELGLDYEYPCMGKPGVIHADNAKEFRGKMLERACKEYGIDLMFRKVKTPRYGAHIERHLGTLMEEIHSLRGTSFSNSTERGDYDSQGRAVMTLKEFDRWLANLIVGYYHHHPHSALNCPPIAKYTRGILGDGTTFGGGVVEVATDEERLRIDFLPLFEATVQAYGIKIDHITYRADVLQRWVGSKEPNRKREARKFLCRRDPRDISYIYFFDPDAQTYFRVPYRNPSHPPISLWELRSITAYMKEQGKKDVDEETIFKSLDEMRRIEDQAEKETSRVRRSERQKRAMRRRDSPQPAASAQPEAPAHADRPPAANPPGDVLPFDEVEWL
jgi:putative transposase